MLSRNPRICSAEVLVHYSADRELVLSCDASPYGVGAVLSHKMDDGSERLLGFVSLTLSHAERRYSQLDKEGLAVIFGIKKFHKYLCGRRFTIYTDHKPLISLFNKKKPIPSDGLTKGAEMGCDIERIRVQHCVQAR